MSSIIFLIYDLSFKFWNETWRCRYLSQSIFEFANDVSLHWLFWFHVVEEKEKVFFWPRSRYRSDNISLIDCTSIFHWLIAHQSRNHRIWNVDDTFRFQWLKKRHLRRIILDMQYSFVFVVWFCSHVNQINLYSFQRVDVMNDELMKFWCWTIC
jgi:hypothetical protein